MQDPLSIYDNAADPDALERNNLRDAAELILNKPLESKEKHAKAAFRLARAYLTTPPPSALREALITDALQCAFDYFRMGNGDGSIGEVELRIREKLRAALSSPTAEKLE